MVKASQFGVSMPGGTEALIHARETLEATIRADTDCGTWACIDIDFRNAYPTLLHDAIDAAMKTRLPELQPWSRWCQDNCGFVYLPSGGKYKADRGAEQGDPIASLQCGCTIADVVDDTMAAMRDRKQPGAKLECFGFWFADDGQYICRPADVDTFLRCLDEAAAKAGLSRGSGEGIKSTVRLVGSEEALTRFRCESEESWATSYVHDTCKVLAPNASIEVLGTIIGSSQERNEAFASRLTKLEQLREDLADIESTGVELLLGRLCASTTKVTHLLRAHGTFLDEELLDRFDSLTADFIDRTLGGDLHSKAIEQAMLGMKFGGLGFRKAELLAAPAHLASLIEARPCVEYLVHLAAEAGIVLPTAMDVFDSCITRATEECTRRLSPEAAQCVPLLCDDATVRAGENFQKILDGSEQAPEPRSQPESDRHDPVLAAPERDDPEIVRALKPIRLQHDLSVLFDKEGSGSLYAHFEAVPGGEQDCTRLLELSDDTVSSKWLWTVDPHSPLTLSPEHFIAAVRLRLGASFTSKPVQCRICSKVLDINGMHALCCAPGESTRGHNAVRDELFVLARIADTTAEREVLGLLDTAPGLRPADILTCSVLPSLSSALDIGIAAPHAAHAGSDCCETMRWRKVRNYAEHDSALLEQGIQYTPIVWSCWGREHADTTRVLKRIARVVARRRGGSHDVVLSSLRDAIGSILARRAAAMLGSCTPAPEPR